MSIADFMAKAKAEARPSSTSLTTLVDSVDVSTEDFQTALNALEAKEVTKFSISDEQFNILKGVINDYRKQIEQGNFVPTIDKLHNIVMWYRVSRETAFVAIKEKIVKEKKPRAASTRKKKEVIVIDDLM